MFLKCLFCSEELEETYRFCARCGAAVDKEEVLIRYFQRGFDYSAILLFLKKYHTLEISMRTLHNRLREYGLRRRNTNSDDGEIYQAIEQELDGPGCMRGYKLCGIPFIWIMEYRHQEERWKEFYGKLILKEQPCEGLMH